MDRAKIIEIRNVPGVRQVRPVGFAMASILLDRQGDALSVALVGVEPGQPGAPSVLVGDALLRRTTDETVIDETIAATLGIGPGDDVTIRSVQGGDEEFYTLRVIGVTDRRKYGIRPSLLVPYVTWDRIRTQMMAFQGESELRVNVMAVQLDDPTQIEAMKEQLRTQVRRIDVADLTTAYQEVPGYVEQQSTLSTQQCIASVGIGQSLVRG